MDQSGVLDARCSNLNWKGYQRLAVFVAGLGVGSFFFCFILSGLLLYSHRPVHPDVTLGYTYLFKIKSHEIYGNYFELVAVTIGPWASWICGLIAGSFASLFGISRNSRTLRLHIFAGAVTSLAFNLAAWQACTYLFRP